MLIHKNLFLFYHFRNIIVNHFANYRYNGDNPELLLYQMKRDSLEYDNILKEKEQNKSLIENASFQSLELSNELNSFFKLISMQELPYKKAIDIIKRDIATINTLSSIIKEYSINKQEIKNKMEEATKTVDDFYKSIKVSKDIAIDQINQDVLDYQRINDEYLALEKKANEYKMVNSLQERIENVEYDMDNLKDDMDKKNSMYNNLKLEIEELEDRTSVLDDKIISLTNLKEEKERADKKAKMLESLMNELGNADQILKDKYVAPIKDKFCEYASIIEEAIGNKVSMDKNYKISFDREGALRSSEHLSSGILAICALCFRLALLDNMFEDEKPFLIMDDPFVSLDEAHIKKAKDLMEILASDKQII